MLFHNIFLEFDAGQEFNMFIARLIKKKKKISLSFSTVNDFSGTHAFVFKNVCVHTHICMHSCTHATAHV